MEAALAYAARGWGVFPCRADKRPYSSNGVLDATTDPRQIEAWWAQYPRANIGFDVGGAGMMVLDFDPGHDRAELERNVGKVPATLLRQRTPRGGEHAFYALKDEEVVSASTSKIAKHVDVRSFHSYVLLAPSQTADGSYEWLGDPAAIPAYRTDEMVRVANSHKEKHADRDHWLIQPDLPENVELATVWLRDKARIAVEGQGGDHAAYATAAMMKSFGLSEAMAFDLMWSEWNPRCNPPWTGDEVDHLAAKIENAYAYNTSPPGNMTPAYTVARQAQLFQPVEKEMPEGASGRELTLGRFRIVDRKGMKHIRPARWLVNDLLPEGGFGLLYGYRGSYKTFVAMDVAMTVATGFPVDPCWSVNDVGPVLFAAGEGRPGLEERVTAWEALHLGGREAEAFHLLDPVPPTPFKGNDEELRQFIELALLMSPGGYKLCVIDTVGKSMRGMNENAQEYASAFTGMVETLQRALATGEDEHCAVLAIHHAGHEGADHARGSSVFEADADTIIRVEGGERKVRLHMTKQKDAEQWKAPVALAMQEACGSIVAMPSQETKPAALPSPQVKKAQEAFTKELLLSTLDKATKDFLASNRIKEYSDNMLANDLAATLKIPSSTLRKRLKGLRETDDVTLVSPACYDIGKRRWRYRD